MLLQHLALVSTVPDVSLSDLAKVSAALQRQVLRDLAPIWGLQASIDPFPSYDDVPPGYWPVVIVDEAPQAGSHTDRDGHPMAFVEYGPTWSLRASHEVVEMLVDETGRRMIPGYAPSSEERVEFLVEVCDPCQDGANAYTVNGIIVSDFCTPEFYSPAGGARFDFRGLVETSHQVLKGGYLSWREPISGDWFQMSNTGVASPIKNLGPIASGPTGFRARIDELTPSLRRLSRLPSEHAAAANARRERVREASLAQADRWRRLAKAIARSAKTTRARVKRRRSR
jgi:hypothetical protein